MPSIQETIPSLRKFYIAAGLPALLIFAACFLMSDGTALISPQTAYYVMTALLATIFGAYFITFIYMRHAFRKCEGLPADEQAAIYGRAYKLRIIALNVSIALTGIAYLLTAERNCLYIFAMFMVFTLLYYPTERLILRNN